ncbi:MAG TPA: P-II family nitrogen regulator [Gelria sp.]|nr:P-II family nitrogen regulator [Gelria sp.]
MENKIPHDLIVTIVNKGDAEKVVDASKKAGAEGGTIILGRGTGIHEQTRLFGIVIEPQKDIVLTLVKRKISDQVLEAIVARAELNKPGRGIAYVIPVERVAGITHLIPEEE